MTHLSPKVAHPPNQSNEACIYMRILQNHIPDSIAGTSKYFKERTLHIVQHTYVYSFMQNYTHKAYANVTKCKLQANQSKRCIKNHCILVTFCKFKIFKSNHFL